MLQSNEIDIIMCRVQGYDNAATMPGIHVSLQVIVISNACVDHLLKLCGEHSCAENVS